MLNISKPDCFSVSKDKLLIRICILFLFICTAKWGFNQAEQRRDTISDPWQYVVYDKDLPPADVFRERRQKLRDSLPPHSLAVIFSSPVKNRSGDMDYDYHPHPDLYYLTGFREPNAMLMIYKEHQIFDSVKTDEVLFVQPKYPSVELWSGKRMGTEMAGRTTAVKTVLDNRLFAGMDFSFDSFDKIYYIPPGHDMRDDPDDKGDLYSLYHHFLSKTSSVQAKMDVRFLKELITQMRQQKSQVELTFMMRAIDITCNAQKEAMKAAVPGLYEYQIQALMEFVFKYQGAEHPAFSTICGSGENACILHYASNRKQLHDGEMMVMDAGAEYHGYCADVTRTIPVNGTFTENQKVIYGIVLKAQKAAIAQCREGNKFWDPNEAAKEIIANELYRLGIIRNQSDYHHYFMHGTSHYLGLDVHDVGLFNYLHAGDVITVEPGIYIPSGSPCDPKWWGIGVRIEDDVLITGGEPEVLSSAAPKEIKQIEELMKQESNLLLSR